MKVMIVVDMQNDFIDGALGTPEAVAIVPNVVAAIEDFDGELIYTRDTHGENYLNTQEGQRLPVEHCIEGSHGWELCTDVARTVGDRIVMNKPGFGSTELGGKIKERLNGEEPESITLIGLCTDICVISNAMLLKAEFPEVPIIIKADCCAGVTPESHENALSAMQVCQIEIL